MLHDFEVIKRKFPDNKDITIIPISDVHLGAAEHMEKEWNSFCDMLSRSENTYITLGGDLINNGIRTSVSNVFDETMRPREQKNRMVEMLTPIKDKILCAVSGNHERRSVKDSDDDITYDILCKLDKEDVYRENMAFLKIKMGRDGINGQHNPSYVLCVTHGSGGGILSGGAINRNERFGYAIDGVDCLIVGHTHKPMVSQPAKIVVDRCNDMVSIKPFKVVSSTSFLGFGGYAAQKMLLPTSHALQTITLAGKHKEVIVTM